MLLSAYLLLTTESARQRCSDARSGNTGISHLYTWEAEPFAVGFLALNFTPVRRKLNAEPIVSMLIDYEWNLRNLDHFPLMQLLKFTRRSTVLPRCLPREHAALYVCTPATSYNHIL